MSGDTLRKSVTVRVDVSARQSEIITRALIDESDGENWEANCCTALARLCIAEGFVDALKIAANISLSSGEDVRRLAIREAYKNFFLHQFSAVHKKQLEEELS